MSMNTNAVVVGFVVAVMAGVVAPAPAAAADTSSYTLSGSEFAMVDHDGILAIRLDTTLVHRMLGGSPAAVASLEFGSETEDKDDHVRFVGMLLC